MKDSRIKPLRKWAVYLWQPTQWLRIASVMNRLPLSQTTKKTAQPHFLTFNFALACVSIVCLWKSQFQAGISNNNNQWEIGSWMFECEFMQSRAFIGWHTLAVVKMTHKQTLTTTVAATHFFFQFDSISSPPVYKLITNICILFLTGECQKTFASKTVVCSCVEHTQNATSWHSCQR